MLAPAQLLGPLSYAVNQLLQRPPSGATPTPASIPLLLDALFNARAASSRPLSSGEDGFDGRGGTYPANDGCLPRGSWSDAGVEFELTHDWGGKAGDHVLSAGQTIALREPIDVSALHLLVAGDFYDGDSQEAVTAVYEDGSERDVAFAVKDWWSIHWLNKAPIRCSYRLTPLGPNYNTTHIHHVAAPIPVVQSPGPALRPPQKVKSLRLPPARAVGQNRLHVFAISLLVPATSPADDIRPALHVRTARTTSRWTLLPDGRKAQSVVLALENRAPAALAPDERVWLRAGLEVSLGGLPKGFELVRTGQVGRLMPGDAREVELLVAPAADRAVRFAMVERDCPVQVRAADRNRSQANDLGTITLEGPLVADWDAFYRDPDVNLAFHISPKWFDDAKFGIFIHFGLFSVPAWTDRGRYAEWYWYWLHEDAAEKSSTWQHHRERYGEDFAYDDFILAFTGAKFNADEWAQLISDAGAKYFVLTTKHHDGFALFDTLDTSDRSSVKLAPGSRDYVRELFDAADRQGGLRKGTYFSMPEWFSPSYAPYGWERFPGGLPPDVFHPGEHEPYTGWRDVGDYVENIQLAQMQILGDMGTDIMWCDIGGANHSSAFLSQWYANSSSNGRQVTTNNRCGVAPDFDTPEYDRFATVQPRKWETCEGIDPWSFGYNKATKDEEYRSSKDMIHNLIDITSKNGNYLLNVGPTGEGEIIQVMQARLREVGAWLKVNGEAIYETAPLPLLPELTDEELSLDLRFTRTDSALYILSLSTPSSPIFRIPARLPVMAGDRITLLGPQGEIALEWTYNGKETLDIALPRGTATDGQAAYVFKVTEG